MKTIRRVIMFLFIVLFGLQIPASANSATDSAVKLPEKPATHIQLNISRMVAYIASDLSGFSVNDIQNTGNMAQIAHIDLPESETVSSMQLNDSYVYLSTKKSLYAINVSDSTNPILTGNIPIMTDGTLSGFEIDSDRIYLFDQNKIYVYSTINQAMPSFLKTVNVNDPLNAKGITDIAVRNNIVYIASGHDGVQIIDFTDINNVMKLGRLNDIQALGDTILLPDDSNEMHLIDTSDMTVPEESMDNKSNATLHNSDQKTAYITIDDGPSTNNTPKNLDTLKKYGVKATFFVLPHDNMDDIYKRIIEEGHVVGNHGCVHDYTSLYGSMEYFKKDVTKARDFIYKKFGYSSTVYRFPGGSMGRKKETIKRRADLLGELGYRYFDWDVSTADTDPNLRKYGTEEQIVNLLANNVIKGAKNKKKLIILMHDSAGKTYTAKALPKIIEGLQKQGYVFDVLTNY